MRRSILATLMLGSMSLTLALSGCAALLAGGSSKLEVSVEEPQEDVDVLIDGVSNDHHIRRKVPFFTVTLDRHSDYTLRVRSRGYQSLETRIGRQVQPQVLGDLVVMGLGAYGIYYGNMHPGERIESLGGIPVMSLGLGLAGAGLLGLGWDAVSGALWRHAPSDVVVTLEKEPSRPLWPFW
jgi:hypothetical protein